MNFQSSQGTGLKWKDINLTERTITVHRQIMRVNGEIIESPLKTKNSYRKVPIGVDVVEILKYLKANSISEYVFCNKEGKAISPDSVLNMLHRVLKRANLPKVRFHDLRHTFALCFALAKNSHIYQNFLLKTALSSIGIRKYSSILCLVLNKNFSISIANFQLTQSTCLAKWSGY